MRMVGAIKVGLVAMAALIAGVTVEVGGASAETAKSSVATRVKKPQVRGYVLRRGGYSYAIEDSINTYGNNRTRFGGADAYRYWKYDRQSPFGPFDHGFFFDSGINQGGGYAPYQH